MGGSWSWCGLPQHNRIVRCRSFDNKGFRWLHWLEVTGWSIALSFDIRDGPVRLIVLKQGHWSSRCAIPPWTYTKSLVAADSEQTSRTPNGRRTRFPEIKGSSSSLTHAVISIAADKVARRLSPRIIFAWLQAPRLLRDIIRPREQPVNICNGQKHIEWFYWDIREKENSTNISVGCKRNELYGKFLPFLLGSGRDNRNLRCSVWISILVLRKPIHLKPNFCNAH